MCPCNSLKSDRHHSPDAPWLTSATLLLHSSSKVYMYVCMCRNGYVYVYVYVYVWKWVKFGVKCSDFGWFLDDFGWFLGEFGENVWICGKTWELVGKCSGSEGKVGEIRETGAGGETEEGGRRRGRYSSRLDIALTVSLHERTAKATCKYSSKVQTNTWG